VSNLVGCQIFRLLVSGGPSSSAAQRSHGQIVLVAAQQPSAFLIQWLQRCSRKSLSVPFGVVNETNRGPTAVRVGSPAGNGRHNATERAWVVGRVCEDVASRTMPQLPHSVQASRGPVHVKRRAARRDDGELPELLALFQLHIRVEQPPTTPSGELFLVIPESVGVAAAPDTSNVGDCSGLGINDLRRYNATGGVVLLERKMNSLVPVDEDRASRRRAY
jgi:hypothetical protein